MIATSTTLLPWSKHDKTKITPIRYVDSDTRLYLHHCHSGINLQVQNVLVTSDLPNHVLSSSNDWASAQCFILNVLKIGKFRILLLSLKSVFSHGMHTKIVLSTTCCKGSASSVVSVTHTMNSVCVVDDNNDIDDNEYLLLLPRSCDFVVTLKSVASPFLKVLVAS